jgi:cell division septation protein DedD
MTRTENEQELVLGNKQLLSAFFVVVALLGVFFTMGYIIGRNTGGNASKDAAKDASANASPPPETAPRAIAPEPSAPAPQTPAAESSESPTTHPAIEEVKKSPPKAVERAAEAAADAAAPTTPVAVQSVPGHQYLQLMAVKLPEADKMVALLRRRGLPALIGESSKPDLFRVLVGPFSDTASLARTKSSLKDLGFESVVSK